MDKKVNDTNGDYPIFATLCVDIKAKSTQHLVEIQEAILEVTKKRTPYVTIGNCLYYETSLNMDKEE